MTKPITRYLSHNVQVSVEYSNSPLYPGDTLYALIRFSHIDPGKQDLPEPSDSPPRESEPRETENSDSPTWSRRISSQFLRLLFFSQFDASENDAILRSQIDSSETFLSASLQLFGHYRYNDQLVDPEKFSSVRASGLISGCIGGVPSLRVSHNPPKSFLQNFSSSLSHILALDIGEMDSSLNSSSTADPDLINSVHPLFSTPQLLLFPTLTINAGDSYLYYLKIPLPKTLPPSYTLRNLSISYSLILNTERLSNAPLHNVCVTFPLKISICPRSDGFQVVPSLCSEFSQNRKYLLANFEKKTVLIEVPGSATFETLPDDVNGFQDISESPELDTDESKALRDEFVATMETLALEKSMTTSEQIRSLPNSPLLHHLKTPNIDSVVGLKSPILTSAKDVLTYKSIIGDQKTSFMVKFRNRFSTRLVFDKPYYHVGESIALCFDFTDDLGNAYTTSGITVTLESQEKFRYEYLQEYSDSVNEMVDQFENNPKEAYKAWKLPLPENPEDNLAYVRYTRDDINNSPNIEKQIIASNPNYWKQFVHIHWIKKYLTLSSKMRKLNVNNMFLNHTLTPQFKTDIFELKYYLMFKFVVVEEPGKDDKSSFLQSALHDTNGDLYSGKTLIDGSVFTIRIPFNVVGKARHD